VGPPVILTPEERGAKTKEEYDRIARRIMDAIAALD
jgi:hypothetical protein